MKAKWATFLLAVTAAACVSTAGEIVYELPIRGQIEPALLYVLRRGISEAERKEAQAIVFTMDTPGGTVQAAEEIITLIQSTRIPTYTLVERNAISAGAIIALATDYIYMTPGSKIGDAMPIMASPMGGAQEMPEALEEKTVSYVAGLIRATAQESGHDDQLAETMVRRELEYRVDGEVLVREGELLTLTSREAERRVGPEQRPLLSAGTVADLEELLQLIGLADAEVLTLQVTTAEHIARWLAAIGPLLLMAGLLGIYIEIRTPGLGLPGALGAAALALFFWGHHIAGLAGMEEIALFVLGVTLLALEIFVIPGFGIAGLAGIGLILFSLLMAMVPHLPGTPFLPQWQQLHVPLLKLSAALLGSFIGALLMARFLPSTSIFKRLVLADSTSRDQGYTASRPEDDWIGRRGRTVSSLRPAGTALFEDRRRDVVTSGEYIPADTAIRVVDTHGNRLTVEAAPAESRENAQE